ncbi:hypothetical protein MLD38_032640 [Melastoma candidum]|uniref:Uncharacterized protein n=1 Tax=Melastoma candidum TaxID=119954 RepID=A0ACB9M409_9MYRT|nr:hypothetical protein MLD38_032640 [Melastoma candidum]
MAAPSASILSFVIFIITISSSCYAPAALAVPETREVAFPSQAILPIGGIVIPPIVSAVNISSTISITLSVGGLLSNITLLNLTIPNASLPTVSLPNIPLRNITLPNVTGILPLTINVNASIPGVLSLGLSLNILNGVLSGLLNVVGSGGSPLLPIQLPISGPLLPQIP